MSIYQENKIFINKFKSYLEQELKKHTPNNLLLTIFFQKYYSKEFRLALDIDLKFDDVVYEEVGKKFYFGVTVKETRRYFSGTANMNQKDTRELAEKLYADKLSRYYITDELVKELKDFIKINNVTLPFNSNVGDADKGTLIQYFKDNPTLLRGFDKVKSLEFDVKDVLSCQIDLSLHPDVYKSLKNRNMLPVAYIDTDKNSLYYLNNYLSSRKDKAFDDVVLTDKVITSNIKYIATHCISYLPERYWIYADIKSNVVDKKRIDGYNFDI